MKNLGAYTNDGFKGSIEFPRFLRDMNADIISALTAIIGTSPTFIKGGEITEDGVNTTINSGIIMHNSALWSFTGGTFAGAPGELSVVFSENTAPGYPDPYFVGDSIPKKIYLSKTAVIGSGSGAITLTSIGHLKNLSQINDEVAVIPSKAGKNAYQIYSNANLSYNSITPVNFGIGNDLVFVQEFESGIVSVKGFFVCTSNKSWSSVNDNWIIRGLPGLGSLFANGAVLPVFINHHFGDYHPSDRYIYIEHSVQGTNSNRSELSLGKGFSIQNGNLFTLSFMYVKT